MNIESVIKTAIKMEEEGYDFYKKSASCSASATGKKMFDFLADYELRHKVILEGMLRSAIPAVRDIEIPLPKAALKNVFADSQDRLEEDVCVSQDDVDALTFAMGKETDSFRMYSDAAESSSDPNAKAVFERIALEEKEHYDILEQTRYFLTENKIWSIWQDGGPIEG
ncbi:MAG TPA: ferritin family protein [Nitrospirota bacterium]